MAEKFDLVVVGSGPGGYIAAVRASQLGFRTAIVERERLGGVCLNWGCIPTKALLRGAELFHQLKLGEQFGIRVENSSVDLAKLVGHSRGVADKLSGGIAWLMRKHNVTVIEGNARVSGKCQLEVATGKGSTTIEAAHIVLATGAHARDLPGIPFDGELVWSAREAMTPKALPQKLLIIGAGAIGVEFASLYNDLGSEVTLVEALPRILPVEDADVSAFVDKAFRARGMTIHTGAKVEGVRPAGNGVSATLNSNGETRELQFDRVILAVGIGGNLDGLGLEALGVKLDRGFIATDEYCRTNVVGLYAIGDIAGPPWLAHKASHEAVICVEKIAGVAGVKPLDKSHVPGCTYCRPQVASVGLSESAARESGREIRVGRFDLAANGKALAIGEAAGFVKTVFDASTGELLGAHMTGPEVTEQIQGFALARGMEATEAELKHAIFPHPTLSEAMHESVLDAWGEALNH